jgi:hypothetical protein
LEAGADHRERSAQEAPRVLPVRDRVRLDLANPALSLKPAKVMPNPTLPFEEREMARILAAGDDYQDHLGRRRAP